MFTPAHYRYGNMQLQFLDTVGDGTGSIAMNVDGSVTPVQFKLTCPPGEVLYLESLSMFLQDGGAFSTNAYGALPALTNGTKLLIFKSDGTLYADITDQLALKTNADWISYSFRIDNFDFVNSQSILALSYNLPQNGRPLRLSPGDWLCAIVRDNLSALSAHRIRTSSVRTPITIP